MRLVHVKLGDTGEAVARLVAERAAGRADGSIDLLWINGENFAALKRAGLLWGPFVDRLPAARGLDPARARLWATDFTVPVEGLEAPWGVARFALIHDRARTPAPPRDAAALLAWARANPGRFTYPAPPDFVGVTFVKQLLLATGAEPVRLARAPDDAAFARASAPVFAYLDRLHRVAWRGGRAFPASAPAQRQLLADGEVDFAPTFNPAEIEGEVAAGRLPATVATFALEPGAIANAHFLAIPAGARAKAGAMVAIDFLLGATAQRRKADPAVWGDAAVLAGLGGEVGPTLPEPHPGWTERLERGWTERYGR